jgi:hypothetical protein
MSTPYTHNSDAEYSTFLDFQHFIRDMRPEAVNHYIRSVPREEEANHYIRDVPRAEVVKPLPPLPQESGRELSTLTSVSSNGEHTFSFDTRYDIGWLQVLLWLVLQRSRPNEYLC